MRQLVYSVRYSVAPIDWFLTVNRNINLLEPEFYI